MIYSDIKDMDIKSGGRKMAAVVYSGNKVRVSKVIIAISGKFTW